MNFRGLSDYQTGDAGRLRSDLQRQNRAIGDALGELENEREALPVTRDVLKDTDARLGEMLLVGASVRISLPKSSPENAGRSVMIVSTKATSIIDVAAAPKQYVMGALIETISASVGLRRYYDDGRGNWWRSI